MPWHASSMGARVVVLALLLWLPLAMSGCTDDDDPSPPDGLTDARCAVALPDSVFATLGWSAPAEPAEATVRGCHRETEQGYVEVRTRPEYAELCATLDRTGTPAPGQAVDWLGEATACAVEPVDGLGQTKVAVKHGDRALLITVVALVRTDQAKVRAAVEEVASRGL